MDIILWLIVFVILLGVELLTMGLTTVWFAGGAAIALVVAMFNGPVWLQTICFFVISILLLIFTRPVARKYINKDIVRTNVDSLIGAEAKVISKIDNNAPSGDVLLNGQEWTARSLTGEIFEEEDRVLVHKIEGVKLIVKRKEG